MGLFNALVGVVIETVKLPVSAVKDLVMVMDPDRHVGQYTKESLEKIKKEAEKADHAE